MRTVKAIGKNSIMWLIERLGKLVHMDRPQVFYEVDLDFNNLYSLALEKTQMQQKTNTLKKERNYILYQLINQVLSARLDGYIAECGCWRGLSAYEIALSIKKYAAQKKFLLFDSFEGLSDFKEEDIKNSGLDARWRQHAKELIVCSLQQVQHNLQEFDFIEYHKGWIPATFKGHENQKFAFVHIDVDLYEPTKACLEFFYPRMVPDGIILLDDYGYLAFPGAKKAMDGFMHGKKDLLMAMPCAGAFLVKD